MVRVECAATQGFLTFLSMPLLTELVSSEDGCCYRHDAPDGAVPGPGFGFRVSRLDD